jgi:hypothetical protein
LARSLLLDGYSRAGFAPLAVMNAMEWSMSAPQGAHRRFSGAGSWRRNHGGAGHLTPWARAAQVVESSTGARVGERPGIPPLQFS